MTAIEIHNTAEAKQRLYDALNVLDAISAYSISHRLPSEQLFDTDVRIRLQSLYPKLPSPIYPLLEESDELSEDEKKTLSPYCYKIKDSAGDFDDVLGGLEAYYKQMNAQNLASKGELIDTIIRGGVSKTIRSVAVILDVLGGLTLWHIREVEARALATERGHKLVSQEDKSNAATKMWQYLSSYNSDADRAKLDARITAGIRWNRFLGEREIGMIVTVHKLPPSLKFQTKLIVKLALIVAEMPGMLDQAKKATTCMQKLLDSRLGPWTGSKKRQLPVQNVLELSPERRGPDTEAESGISGTNSIGALLNAAELIAAARQDEALDQHRKRRRFNSFPLSNEDRGSIVTVENPEGIDLKAEIVPLNSSVSQLPGGPISDRGGMIEQTTRDGNFGVPQAQDDDQVEASGIAMMADVDKLGTTLGGYLFKGMNTSRRRKGEKDGGMTSFTDTVRLHFAYHKGEDFKLEVWVCSSIGKAILQTKIRSIEDLGTMLGDYLFGAMKASNRRKEEEREGMSDRTGAIDVSFPNGDDGSDCKVEVILNFGTGKDVYENIFPCVN